MAVAFLAVAVPLAVTAAWASPDLPAVAMCVAVYAAASVVEFEVGTGSAVPTQLVLVPMLFVLPLGIVPLAAAGGYVDRRPRPRGVPPRRSRPAPLVLAGIVLRTRSGPVVVLMAAGGGDARLGSLAGVRGGVRRAVRLRRGQHDHRRRHARSGCARPCRCARSAGCTGSMRSWRRSGWRSHAGGLDDAAAILVGGPARDRACALFARDRRARTDALIDLGRTYRGTALVLGDVIEADDTYTGTHSRNVLELSLAVADALRLDGATRREVEFTSLLHDIGKLRIPNSIIQKPGPLTPAERALIETHTLEGERILGQIGGFLGHIGRMVRSCHERWDGGGYPDGLTGERIPVAARIVSCCDAFDAMTSDRPYRRARSTQFALGELAAGAGSQFDPAVVAAVAAIVAGGAGATVRKAA